MPPIVSFVGKSNSGKTTVLEKLLPVLKKRGLRIAVIKHALHGFEIDRQGKDSYVHGVSATPLLGETIGRAFDRIARSDPEREALVAEKAELSRAAGADHVIEYRSVDFGDAIADIAGPRPIDVVYDGVGRTTFEKGISVLKPRGMMVTFGNASGPVDPVSPLDLMRNGSLFLTRPTLFDYIATPAEFRSRASALFEWIENGDLDVRIGATYPMSEAAAAHTALESRQTTGKVLLIP